MALKLYVGNMPYDTGEQELTELFSSAGTVDKVSVMRDMATGRARGFAFVEMASEADAQNAINTLNNYNYNGRNLTVNEAKPKTPVAVAASAAVVASAATVVARNPAGNSGLTCRDARSYRAAGLGRAWESEKSEVRSEKHGHRVRLRFSPVSAFRFSHLSLLAPPRPTSPP